VEKAEANLKYNNENNRKKTMSKPIKAGMKVALTSPRSKDVVALATVLDADSGDHIQVTINMIMRSTTILPQAQGKMRLLGHAQPRSVSWPRHNVSTFSCVT
jgi:hypothetical protein